MPPRTRRPAADPLPVPAPAEPPAAVAPVDDPALHAALSAVGGAVMLATPELRVAWANPRALALLRAHEGTLARHIAGLSAQTLIGFPADRLCGDGRGLRAAVADPTRFPFEDRVVMDGLVVELRVPLPQGPLAAHQAKGTEGIAAGAEALRGLDAERSGPLGQRLDEADALLRSLRLRER